MIHASKIKNKEEDNSNGAKERDWVVEEHLLVADTSGIEISQVGREAGDENFEQDCPKFPSDTSSSDLTQGTPLETGVTDDLQAQFPSDEANSSANLYSLNLQYYSSDFIQVQCSSWSNYENPMGLYFPNLIEHKRAFIT